MKILLDNNIPIGLANDFPGHDVRHCRDLGWQTLTNGELVRAASQQFDLLITIDKNMRHQTNLRGIDLSVVVLNAHRDLISDLRALLTEFHSHIESFEPGQYTVLG